MAPAFTSLLLCGSMGFRVSGGRKSPFPFLRFGVLRSLFDVWPSTPERFIGAEWNSPGPQLIVPTRPRDGTQFFKHRPGIRRANAQVVRDFQILARYWVEGEGISSLAIVMGRPQRPLLLQPSVDPPGRGLAGHEPTLALVAPSGTRKCLLKPLHRHSIVRKAGFGTNCILFVRRRTSVGVRHSKINRVRCMERGAGPKVHQLGKSATIWRLNDANAQDVCETFPTLGS